MNYRIMGTYQDIFEELDQADDIKDAEYLRAEYQLAFGSSWVIWVEEK